METLRDRKKIQCKCTSLVDISKRGRIRFDHFHILNRLETLVNHVVGSSRFWRSGYDCYIFRSMLLFRLIEKQLVLVLHAVTHMQPLRVAQGLVMNKHFIISILRRDEAKTFVNDPGLHRSREHLTWL